MQFPTEQINGISIVIPNYNGLDLLPLIIPPAQVAAQNSGLKYEIIVVDDCSTDESIKLLHEYFPDVRCIKNEANAGFSNTSNKGIYAAQYNWVLLLNSDVILEPDYFQPLLKYTNNHTIFGITGRILGWDDNNIQDAAKLPHLKGIKLKTFTNYLLNDETEMQNGLYSIYLSGSNIFFNKKIFGFLGGFNESFSPFYVEDTELSLRAWRLGFVCVYEHHAVCRHRTSSTIYKASTQKYVKVISSRNRMQMHAIHLQKFSLFTWWMQFIGETIIKIFILNFSYLHSAKLFIKHLPHIRKSRKDIAEKTTAAISVQQVVKKITDPLEGKEYKTFLN